MSDSVNSRLYESLLAQLPVDSSGGLIPTPAEPGVARIDFATDDQGLHQGDIGQFGYTDDLTPTLGGIQEVYTAGLEITIFCNTKAIGTAIVGNDGHWSFTPDVPFEPNHEYIFNTVVSDSATDNFLISLPYTLYTTEYNGDLPASVTLEHVADDIPGHNGVTGFLHQGDVTNDDRPSLTGLANAGARVNIYDNGELVGHTTAKADGTWSYTPPALSDGVHYLSASVFTAAGESHRSASFGITVDTHATTPLITEVYDNAGTHTGPVVAGGKTDDSQPLVSGTAEAGSVVTLSVYSAAHNHTFTLSSVTADSSGHWSYQLHGNQSITSKTGDWTFTAQAVDVAGNQSALSQGYVVETVAGNADNGVVPAITGITDDVGLHQGNIADGGKTDDKQPGLHGTGEPNSTVIITMYAPVSQRELPIATVEVGPDGTWHYQFTGKQALQSGNNVFHITTQDTTGHTVSGHSYTVDLVGSNQDVDRPDAPTIDGYHDNAGSASGDFKSGTTTDDSTPTLNGHAAANSVVKIYEGSTLLGSVTADKEGDWNFTPSARSEGKHTFTATATDAAGHASAHSGNFVINIDIPDTTAPDAPVITQVYDDVGLHQGPVAHGGKTDDAQVNISGSAEANSIVTVYGKNPSGKNYTLGTATTDASGHWAYQMTGGKTLSSALGKWTFTAIAHDAAGNKSATSQGWTVDYVHSNHDTTAPDAPTITNAYDNVGPVQGDKLLNNGVTDDTTPELRGHAQVNSIVKVYEGSTLLGSAITDKNGDWSFTPSARSEGKHTFTATATDAAGNTSGHSGNFVITIDLPDTTAPDAPVITQVYDDVGVQTGPVANGGKTDDAQVKISGSAEANSTVTVYAKNPSGTPYTLGTATTDASGHWAYQMTGSKTLSSALGKWTFTATANDAAGNKSASSKGWAVDYVHSNQDDTTVPKAPTITNAYDNVGPSQGDKLLNNGVTDDTTPELRGHAQANSIVKVYEGSTLLGSAVAKADGTWSFETPVRSEGKHTFTATATNAAGHASGHSGNFVVTVDLPDLDFTETFNSHSGTVFSNSGVYHLDYFDVSVVSKGSGYYSPGFNSHSYSVSKPVSSTAMVLGLSTNVKLEMKNPVTDISFKIGDLTTNEVLTVKYINENGSVIGTQSHTRSEGLLTTASYHTTEGNEIASIQMSLTDAGYSTIAAYVWIDDVVGHSPHAATQSLLLSTPHLMALAAESNDPLAHDVTLATLHEAPQHGVVALNDGNQNTLHLTLNDILSEAHQNLFVQDGRQQLAVTGDQGDVVELKVEDLAHNSWQDAGQVTTGGIHYEMYQHTGGDVELLVQHGLELHLMS